jgi:hypothetical protein
MSQAQFSGSLRREMAGIGGATFTVFSNVWAGNMKQIQLELRGEDSRELARIADEMVAVVRLFSGGIADRDRQVRRLLDALRELEEDLARLAEDDDTVDEALSLSRV